MGKKDVVQKIFWEDNERFADLFNVVLGKGEVVLKPEDLTKEEATVLEVVKKDNKKVFVEKYRDVIKKATTDMTCILIGIEHQSAVNYTMPLRVMLWDALSYEEQVRELERQHKKEKTLDSGAEYLSGIKKEEKLKPVCTIVVYYSEREWDGSRNLHELLDWNGIPEYMREWIGNYPMILVDIFRFPDWEKFQSDLREVFGFIRNSKDKVSMKKFLAENRERIAKMPEDAYNLMETITGSKQIEQFREKEGGQDMCKAIDDMLKEKYEEGQRDMCSVINDRLKEKYEEGQRDIRQVIDDMLAEQFEEGCKKGLELRQKAEAERQKAELRIKYLEAELERIKSSGKIA